MKAKASFNFVRLDQANVTKRYGKTTILGKNENGFTAIKATFDSRCGCGYRIRTGKMIWFNRQTKQANCYPCGPHVQVMFRGPLSVPTPKSMRASA
jgi:hypothetical protein